VTPLPEKPYKRNYEIDILFGPSADPERQETARQDMRPNRAVFIHILPK